METIVRNRNSKENIIIESNKALNFFYGNFIGRIFIKIAISKPITNLIGKYMNSKFSIKKIDKFIKENNINMYDYENKEYTSYNDFFTRKIKEVKRPINARKDVLISPCDSKLLAYKITKDLTLKIKESYYSIDTLVDKKIMKEYTDGYALVFRLSTDNYHRYCYIDSGTKGKNIHIKGIFHTVQPISLKHYNFYKTNTREYTVLNTTHFGKVIQVEIGAMGIGRIKNNHEEYKYKKGEENGYFEFGGSTIVILVKKNTLNVDKDILENSKNNIETIVKYGEGIAKSKFLKRIINRVTFK